MRHKNKLPNGWKEVTLAEVSLSKGQYGSGASATNYNSKKPRYVRITDINNEGQLKKNSKKSPSITENKYFLEEGDFLFARSGSVGRSYLHMKNKGVCQYAGYLIRFKLDEKIILPEYLFYVTKSKYYWGWINKAQKSVTISNTNAKQYASFSFILPPHPTQKKIVAILKKAEKLREWRKESDALTDEFLKSVFLDLFGDERKNDNNFEVKSFLDIFNTTTGRLDSNAAVENGEYPFFTCSRETFKIDTYSFDCEALLLSGNNAAGKYSVKHYNGKFNAYQRTYVLTLKDAENSFRYLHFLLEKKLEELQSKSIGTNTKYLTLGILRGIKMIIPPLELQQKFASIVEKVEEMRNAQKQSKEHIDDLFNALMQKAFKGELA